MRILQNHEKGTLNRINAWDPALYVAEDVIEILKVLLENRGWSQAHIQFALRICYAVLDLQSNRITNLHDEVIKCVNSFVTSEGKRAPLPML